MSGGHGTDAIANRLRISIAKKLGVDSFQLSMAYLAFHDKLEKANFFLGSADSLLTWRNRVEGAS